VMVGAVTNPNPLVVTVMVITLLAHVAVAAAAKGVPVGCEKVAVTAPLVHVAPVLGVTVAPVMETTPLETVIPLTE